MENGHKSVVVAQKETGRVEAFSDGVFAIAMTLLVLNLKIPSVDKLPSDMGLWRYLLSQWPTFVAYLISFLTILIMWVNHHRLFNHIKRIDDVFMYLNGLLLLSISFVPFPTSLVADYILRENAHTAIAVYSANFVIIAIFFNLTWRYAAHNNRLLAKDADRVAVVGISRQYWFGPPLYLLAFILAFIDVFASMITCFALAIFFALSGLLVRRVFAREENMNAGHDRKS